MYDAIWNSSHCRPARSCDYVCDCMRDHRQCAINVPALTFCNSFMEVDSNLHSKFSNQSTRAIVPLLIHQEECSILGGSACRHLLFSHDRMHIVWWIIRHTMNAHTHVRAFMLSEMFRSRIHQSQSKLINSEARMQSWAC